MSQKIIIREKKRGCLWLFGVLILLCLLFYAIGFAACIGLGIGFWFLIRYIWRSLVREKPGSSLVKWGLGLAPIARKTIAAIPCALLSLLLIGSFADAVSKSAPENNASNVPESQQTQPKSTEGAEKDELSSESPQDEKKEQDKAEKTASEQYDSKLSSLIDKYNARASTQFDAIEWFDAQDRNSGYYRTEYRLGAWKDSRGVHGSIGDASVDFVAYRDGIRMYAQGDSREVLAGILRDAAKVYVPGTSQDIVEQLVDKYLSGEYISINDIMKLGDHVNGTLDGKSLMIEVTGLNQ